MSFMYSGEVELEQGRLDSFLQVGQELKVKGLTKEEAMPQRLSSSSGLLEDTDIKWSANEKHKVKGITWFQGSLFFVILVKSYLSKKRPSTYLKKTLKSGEIHT